MENNYINSLPWAQKMAGSCPLEPERRKTLKVSPFKITAQKIVKWHYVDFARRFDIFFFLQMKIDM